MKTRYLGYLISGPTKDGYYNVYYHSNLMFSSKWVYECRAYCVENYKAVTA